MHNYSTRIDLDCTDEVLLEQKGPNSWRDVAAVEAACVRTLQSETDAPLTGI